MKTKFLKTAFITLFACAALSTGAHATSQGAGTVEASSLNLRSSMSTDASIITTAPRGSIVVVTDAATEDGWSCVWYKGHTGYMSSDYISVSETVDVSLGAGFVNASSVRMRSSASTSSEILGTYDSGTIMIVIGVSGEWYKVNFGGTIGYVNSAYMSLYSASGSNPTTTAANNNAGTATTTPVTTTTPTQVDVTLPVAGEGEESDAGQIIVDTAKKYMGVPYVWGGTSPSGFDCSGLVYYVFRENGYSTNRTAESLYTNGTYVERSNLKVGDIICFTTSKSATYIGHVGIYIGDNKFIHASSGSGCVAINDLSQTYYNNHYYGARRIAT